MHPRRAAAAGIVFIAIAVFYAVFQVVEGVHVDLAGLTMLLALGAAMSIMAYVLFAGLKRS
jgi:hypothetical protein